MVEPRWSKFALFSTGLGYEPVKEPERNLGFAMFLVAIDDYCSIDEEIHEDARDFLYPPTADWQDHFDWAVSLTDGVNPGWLRDALDRSRCSWDQKRADRLSRISMRQRLRREMKANERKTSVEREQAAVAVRVIRSLFNSRARQTVRGLAVLRRTYEYVLVVAVLEGARENRGLYYEAYVDALEIVSARALWVAKTL